MRSWTVGRRLTLNLGVRLDKENLPTYQSLPGFQGIDFGWGQKVAPRLGAAYDLLGNNKVKVYGSFGYFFDIMKYNLPRGSFGGDYWHDCVYALDTPDYTQIIPSRDAQGHYCPLGGGSTPAVGSLPAGMRFIENHMLNKDGEDHRRLRRLVTRAFTPRMVEQLRPRIQEIADELIDAVESRGEMDLVDEFAFPLPITVIAELLGIPVADRDRFRRWTNAMVTPVLTPEDMAQFGASIDEFVAYLRELFERRSSTPGDDLVSADEPQGRKLASLSEIV